MTSLPRSEQSHAAPPHGGHRERQPLHDVILAAVHKACDLHEFDAAKALLFSAEMAIRERSDLAPHKRRHGLDAIVAAHERLWLLTHTADSLTSRN